MCATGALRPGNTVRVQSFKHELEHTHTHSTKLHTYKTHTLPTA
jgi:hypothetical protein